MLRDFVICHADPFATFKEWCPFKLRAWHTHPLGSGTTDHIVTLDLATENVRGDLADMETAGTITRLPTLTSGNTLPPGIANHAAFKAAGVLPTHRTWDAMQKMLAALQWPPLHPEYTPRSLSKSPSN